MGFDRNGVKLLIKAKNDGVDFSKVITIGRQGLYLNQHELLKLVRKSGFKNIESYGSFWLDKYADSTFLKILGAETIDSIDASDYEGATVIHDMNIPIPAGLSNKYSVVIDGGSLEHIFNFPVAIKNCMELIKVGGYYIGITPANNFFGHGFYQFSPELYFRIFNQGNGFRLMKMYLYIDRKRSPIYEVSDPYEVGQRVTMRNSFPSYLFVIAQKMEQKEAFDETPQQSDYQNFSWKMGKSSFSSPKSWFVRKIKKIIPVSLIRGSLNFYESTKILRLCKPTGISNPRLIRRIK